MNRFSYLLLCSLVLTSLSDEVRSLEHEGIVGGDLAVKNQFPYHISIEVAGTNICGGAIIDESHVITAAHCIVNRRTKDFSGYAFEVVGGLINVDKYTSNKVRSKVDKMYIPARYIKTQQDETPTGDIAVLKLKEPLNLRKNPNLSKVNLPDPAKTYADEVAIVSGYGYNWVTVTQDPYTGELKETNGGTTGDLRYAKSKVLSTAACQKGYYWPISKDQLCAKVIPKNSRSKEGVCSGDSGGPLVYNGKTLIGVVSSSPTGCREDQAAAIYTRVSSFLDFIDKARRDQPDNNILSKTIKRK